MVNFVARGILCLGIALAAVPAEAKTIVIHMKNKGAEGSMVFEPAFVKAAPGDVIRFVPTDPSHNAETIAGLWPARVKPAKGMINKELAVPVSTPGLYGFKCLPHYGMGMVALVQVGNAPAADVAAARAVRLPGLAAKRMNGYLGRVK
ncbi:Azu1 pseudoazurin (Blue copper protein) [Sphingomonas paucimobilis]|nr:Azu1 pseudoazurin (Blue copper protein) [Sphingomonas paucimobilis]